jgi:cyclohexa-1,5-dienecarbonyl-CoA hydratase
MSETYRTIAADLIEDGAVLRLVMNQPKGNVLTGEMMRELGAALAAHRDDRHLRLVILRGAGGNFSFGASVDEHTRGRVAEMLGTFHQFVRDLAAFPVPVAALVEGRCLGGALEVALCCHLVFAVEGARFACPEIKLGVFAPVLAAAGACRLPGALAERLLLTGEEIDAASLDHVGFAVLLAGGDAEAAVLEWFRRTLAPLSAFALRQATAASRRRSALLRALTEDLPAIERQYLDEVVSSRDGNEGIEAFLARRAPRWEDA